MMKKIHPSLTWILIWLSAFSIGLYFRLYPVFSSMWSQSSDKAAVYVISQIKTDIRNQLVAQHPDMPAAQINVLAQKNFDEVIKKDKQKLLAAIESVTQNLDAGSHQGAKPYLLASDSYYYYGLVNTILETGRMSDQVKGSKYFHPLMSAPFGQWEPRNLHPWVGVIVYKTALLFNPKISVMDGVAITPLVLTGLVLAIFLWTCRLLNCRPIAAWIGAIFFLLAPVFIKRGSFGWFDDDGYNLFFPLLILGLFCRFVEGRLDRRATLITSLLTALSFTLYSLFWHGWGFTFVIVLAAAGLMFLIQFFRKDKTVGHTLLFSGALMILTLLGVSLMFGVRDFFILFIEGLGELKKFTVHGLDLWPSLFIAVGELQKGTWQDIIEMSGGPLFGSVALLGAVAAISLAVRKREFSSLYKILAYVLFLGAALFLTLKAQRFILLCLVPLAVLFAVGVEYVVIGVRQMLPSLFRMKPAVVIFYALLAALVVFPILHTQKTVRSVLNPIFNETWEKALVAIEQQTPVDSVINTWWPPGHFIKAIAKRRVTFDGASLSNNIQGYFTAVAYLTSDERQAAGLLRMLNVSGDKAVHYLTDFGMETSKAVSLLLHIAPRNRAGAAAALKAFLTNEEIEELLKLTHADPPPTYLLIYNELVEKNLGLAWHAKWNFKGLEEINADPARLAHVPASGSADYIQFLWKTMGGPYKYSETFDLVSNEGPKLFFEQNIGINMKEKTVAVLSKNYGKGLPLSLVYEDNGAVIEKVFPQGNLGYSAVLFQNRGRFQTILMDQAMAQSMLVRLYYFKGAGLKLFKPVVIEEDLTGRTKIQVFEVLWDEF